MAKEVEVIRRKSPTPEERALLEKWLAVRWCIGVGVAGYYLIQAAIQSIH